MGRRRRRPKDKGGVGVATVNNNIDELQESSGDGQNAGTTIERNKNQKNQRNKAKCLKEKPENFRLVDKPKLTKEDLMCPICWSTLFEPTTLPCNHSLCQVCLRKHIDETSLTCPCCRMRLSVWSRTVLKDNKLLDEALWNRMKAEFPRLIEARMRGEDTQNVLEIKDDSDLSGLPSLFQEPGRASLDGTLCEEPGALKEELLNMMKQHEKDIAEERAREETASANLIKQIQEEESIATTNNTASESQDFLLAQNLQKEFEEERKSMRYAQTQQQQPKKAIPRNLMNEWTNYSPDICDLPTEPKVKQVRTNLVLNSSKGKTCGKRSMKKRASTSSNNSSVSKASQGVMSRFLASSQNQISSSLYNPSNGSEKPCCSKSLPVHDVHISAFSPTKPTTNLRVFVPAGSLAIPISVNKCYSPTVNRANEELGANTKTPDSINSEIERHFRPIRSAPKTPPRRRPDGTFLPEPKILRTTPIKPEISTSISAYICSPLKQMPDEARPSCATIEKRISNDSGRVSDDSRSPDVGGTGESPKVMSSCTNDRGRISEDYRVTPDDNPRTPENVKKRTFPDSQENCADVKKIKMEVDTDNEVHSPSLLDESYCHDPLSFEITCTQGVITIAEDDEEYLNKEAEALELFRKKVEQEAADRAFAKALQKQLNMEARSTPGGTVHKKYSLRSWLSQKQSEVKVERTTKE